MNRFTHSLWQRAVASGIGLALVSSGVTVWGQERVPEKPSPTQLQAWLAELDSDSYEVREAAAAKLAQAGPAAVDVLASGIVSESAEIAWRSGASLEQIALGSDEKTLARITNILDNLSIKGKPGLKSMAAEMHLRQKHFRHDRAVASLKQNGAVFAGDDMEFGGGPAFFGGPVAIGAPIFVEEVVAEEIVEEAVPVPADAAPAKPAGIFDLLGRALEGALKPLEVPAEDPAEAPAIPKIEIRDADPALVPPVEEKASEPAEDDKPAEEKPAEEKPAAEKPAEPAEVLEEFKEVSEAIEGVPAAQVLAPPPALMEEADIVALDFIGGVGIIDADMEEVETAASLVLGKRWRGGDDGLKVLKDIPEIYSITLNGAKISDASLKYMAELPNLSSLAIRDTKVTRQGLRKLREQNPDMQIQARGQAMLGVNADIGSTPLVLTSIFPNSGASQAGIFEGDIILSVDGAPIKDFSDLTIAVYECKAGDKIRVEYERGGKKKSTVVTLQKRPDDQ